MRERERKWSHRSLAKLKIYYIFFEIILKIMNKSPYKYICFYYFVYFKLKFYFFNFGLTYY